MTRIQDGDAAEAGRDHVAFRTRRTAAADELRVMGGVVAVLILAIGVCGSALPPRSGWASAVPALAGGPGQVNVSSGLQGDVRPVSDQG